MTELTEEQAQEAAKWAIPKVNSRWIWEPDKPHARTKITVVEVKWNGEEWWVYTYSDKYGKAYWNELSRFIETCVLMESTK
jgi:hypothetical protein